jgi:hypothetical protein
MLLHCQGPVFPITTAAQSARMRLPLAFTRGRTGSFELH